MLLARRKLRFLNGGCDTRLTKEQSIPVRTGEHLPTLTEYVKEKLYIDLVSMSNTMRGNQYLLMADDSFSRYCQVNPIPNKRIVLRIQDTAYYNSAL